MTLRTGQQAPKLTLTTTDGSVMVPDSAGRPTLLMFFQEAGTPACSLQVASLNGESETLKELDALAVCVSTDPIERLSEFASSLGGVNLALATDPEGHAAEAFGVYDAEQKRAQRSAFVIAPNGTILLSIAWYNPSNSDQLLSIFTALGVGEAGEGSNG